MDEFSEPVASCTSDVPMCAAINERCAATSDCCPAAPGKPMISCIGGFCAVLQPVL